MMLNIENYKEKIRSATINSIPRDYFDTYFNAFYSSYCEIKNLVNKDQDILDVVTVADNDKSASSKVQISSVKQGTESDKKHKN